MAVNVLITAAGRRSTLVRAFREEANRRGGEVVAADVDPLAPALFAADRAVPQLPTGDARYVEDLLAIVERHSIGLLVPTIDPELPVLARHAASLQALGCVAAVSEERFVTIALDKYTTVRVFAASGIAIPASWLPDQLPDHGLPARIFIKPRRGSASRDAYGVSLDRMQALLPLVDDPIVQEHVDGPEITIDALFDLVGRPIHYVPRLRIRTIGGESVQGLTLQRDPDLEAWIRHVLELCGSQGARGPVTLQIFLASRGPVLSEINPRFGGGFPLGLAAGGAYPAWLLDMVAGIPVADHLGKYEAGLYMTRTWTEHFTRELEW